MTDDIRDPEKFMTHVNEEHGMNFFGPFFNATRSYHVYLHTNQFVEEHTHTEEELDYRDRSESGF